MSLPLENETVAAMIPRLRAAVAEWRTPLVDAMAATGSDPFRILIATIISLRTKDDVTAVVAPRLFALADTPRAMLQLRPEQIEAAIYPAGFYRTKARTILEVSRLLLDEYGGRVPDEIAELLTLPGVGRKTANLVVTAGYGKPGICVDTHVHRITNRWGYVNTKTPEQTEMALREKLPPEHWLEINGLLVSLGQNICHPTSPRCSICPVAAECRRVGVTRSR
ncbi:MAG TPA: endonuclease III [Ardenticatenaceae bacterium]|nr:endonuclease III [Ardenticatenaceae bacterium]